MRLSPASLVNASLPLLVDLPRSTPRLVFSLRNVPPQHRREAAAFLRNMFALVEEGKSGTHSFQTNRTLVSRVSSGVVAGAASVTEVARQALADS